jgi:hypothetical protein
MRLIKSKRLEVLVAYMGETNNKYKFRVKNVKVKSHFGEVDVSVKDLNERNKVE